MVLSVWVKYGVLGLGQDYFVHIMTAGSGVVEKTGVPEDKITNYLTNQWNFC